MNRTEQNRTEQNRTKYKDRGIIINDDCMQMMKKIPDNYIDMILCDLPYGTTKNKWDSCLCFDCLWKQYERIIKDDGAIVLFGSEPFSSELRNSNLKLFKYDWVWDKNSFANQMMAKYQPLKIHEIISVFGFGKTKYYPQGLIKIDKFTKQGIKITDNIGGGLRKRQYKQEYTNYPRSILQFSKLGKKFHPTQKPVELLEYLIKTYSNEGDIVLDNCMGSGSTCIASINTNRKFIGIELESKYYKIAKDRIEQKLSEPCLNCGFGCDPEDKKQCKEYKKWIKVNTG